MALIDDPRAWILRLFEMEEREGRGPDCARFPEGVRPVGVPLDDGEHVFGIYKQKYHFTPTTLIVLDGDERLRIPWAAVRSCSSRHGQGSTFSDLTLTDGRAIRVKVGEFGKGWSGRISQLYHQMIERYGQRATMGKPLMLAREFFGMATDDYSIAPNLEPHPPLASFREAVFDLERFNDGTVVLVNLVEDEELVADAIVCVSPRSIDHFQNFARAFHSDGVSPADEQIIRRVGQVPEGFNVWHVAWD